MEKMTLEIEKKSKKVDLILPVGCREYMDNSIAESDKYRADAYMYACGLIMTE